MENYTRKQLKERWEKAKENMSDPETVESMAVHVVPGIWEVRIFPPWLFKDFLDRKIFEAPDSAIMSRNMSYDPDSKRRQEWGWYGWRYYFDTKEDCYVLELDYNVKMKDKKALPLVRGILDLALVESADSIIGKFKWRIRWLRKIPILRRIPAIFLFYFEMKKLQIVQMSVTARPNRREMPTPKAGYSSEYLELGRLRPIFPFPEVEEPARIPEGTHYARHGGRNEWDQSNDVIRFPKGSESWGKVKLIVICDPRKEGKCIAWLETGDDETFTGEDDICFQ